MEKKYTKEEILGFNTEDWRTEYQSGYPGYRNINTERWIHQREFWSLSETKEYYEEQYKFLHDFRLECLPMGEYPEYVLQSFLDKRFFKDED